MSDFAFLDAPEKPKRDWRDHHRDVLRECFAAHAKHLQDEAEKSLDYARDLMRSGADASDQLQELETFANGLLLATLLLKRETTKGK